MLGKIKAIVADIASAFFSYDRTTTEMQNNDVFIRADALLQALSIVKGRYTEQKNQLNSWESDGERLDGALEALESMQDWLEDQINLEKNS